MYYHFGLLRVYLVVGSSHRRGFAFSFTNIEIISLGKTDKKGSTKQMEIDEVLLVLSSSLVRFTPALTCFFSFLQSKSH